MKILGLGVPELLIILVVVLLIFGPKNLPKLGASIGRGVKSLRKGMSEQLDSVEEAKPVEVDEELEPAYASAESGSTNRVIKKKIS